MPGRSAISERASQTAESVSSEPATNRSRQSATENRPVSKTYSVAASQPVEPEDAYLTGVSRSLQRRLLGLNVSQAKPIPGASVEGIHSTGSYSNKVGVTAVEPQGKKQR